MLRKYNVLDCFAGIGGFSLGFSNSGFNIVAAIEENEKACTIYRNNFPHAQLINEDVNKIDIKELPEFEVLIGWIPTMNLSYAGKAGRKENFENLLFNKEIEIIKSRKPKVFVIESSIRSKNNSYIDNIFENIKSVGYNVISIIVDSEMLSGIPINEKRIYYIGMQKSFGEFDIKIVEQRKKYTFREIMQKKVELGTKYTNYIKSKYSPIINPDTDKVSCNYIYVPFVNDEVGYRRITTIEYARLKGLSNDYLLNSNNNWELYRLIAQSTNVFVAEYIGKQVLDILNRDLDKRDFSSMFNNNEQDKMENKNSNNIKDLTNSKLDRQNILNNELALNEIRQSSNINGIVFEEKLYFTKTMLATFYDIDVRTIERYVAENGDELTANGYEVLKGSRLKKFVEIAISLDAPDMNVGNISNRTSQLAIFDFKSFLNIGMLLVESENARLLRQIMLNIVIDFINKKTGGSTKYINQRDKDFLGAYLQEEDYRREFTDALRDCIDMGQFKYALFTDMIYQSIFKENAKEYREILKLQKKDRTRDTFYAEILDLIASYECGLAEIIKAEYQKQGRKLSNWEVQHLFKEFENLPHWKPLISRARSKMASRDLALRDAFHQQLEAYIKPLEKEEYERFLGVESETIEKLMEENKDVLRRLKERE